MQTGAAAVEKGMGICQKIKNVTPFWSSDSTSGNLSEETWNTNWKEYMDPYVHFSVTYNSQDMEAAQVSISRWVDKTTMGHLNNRVLLTGKKKKKEENFILSDSMDEPGEYYAKWNKPGGERQISYALTFKWNLINKTNKEPETLKLRTIWQ